MGRDGSCGIRIMGLAFAVAITFALFSSVPGAASARGRTMTRSYSGYLLDWVVGECGARIDGSIRVNSGPMVAFKMPPNHAASVDVEISDAVPGQRVMAVLNQTGRHWTGRLVCGRTERPLPIREGRPVFVHLLGGMSDGGPSVVSGGTVTATFYRGRSGPEWEHSASR